MVEQCVQVGPSGSSRCLCLHLCRCHTHIVCTCVHAIHYGSKTMDHKPRTLSIFIMTRTALRVHASEHVRDAWYINSWRHACMCTCMASHPNAVVYRFNPGPSRPFQVHQAPHIPTASVFWFHGRTRHRRDTCGSCQEPDHISLYCSFKPLLLASTHRGPGGADHHGEWHDPAKARAG